MIFGLGTVMIAVGLIFLWVLFKDNDTKRPRDIVEWLGTVLSTLLVISAVALMILAKSSEKVVVNGGQVATEDAFQDAIIEVPASNFSFKTVDQDITQNLDDFKGKVVIVNFWATWCGPCLKEIPDLNQLQKEFGEKGLVVLSVSDEDRSLLMSFENQLELNTESVYVPVDIELPMPFTGAFSIRPASFIIDRTGTVRRYLLGARNYDFLRKAIEPLMEE